MSNKNSEEISSEFAVTFRQDEDKIKRLYLQVIFPKSEEDKRNLIRSLKFLLKAVKTSKLPSTNE